MVTRRPASSDEPVTGPAWRDGIVGYDARVDPVGLRANPANARQHGPAQREAIRRTISQVGWIAPVVVNKRSGLIVDGHARVEVAVAEGSTVPVIWVDLDAEAERLALATFDPLGYMADVDEQALADLLGSMASIQDDLDRMLASMAGVSLTAPQASDRADYNLSDLLSVPAPGHVPTSAVNGNAPETGISTGAVGVRAIVLTYDAPTYDKIIAALNGVPGETNADKLRTLLGVD